MTAPRLPDDLRQRVLAAAQREPSPRRSAVQRGAAGLAVGAAVITLGLFFALGGHQLGARPWEEVAMTAGGWLLVAALATWASVGRGRSMLGRPLPWLLVVAVATTPLLLVWFVFGEAVCPGGGALPVTMKIHRGCFLATSLFALAPFTAFLFARRGSDPVHPGAGGAALGAAAGAWASILIHLHCPVSETLHVFFGHLAPVILLSTAGLLLGRRFLAVRD